MFHQQKKEKVSLEKGKGEGNRSSELANSSSKKKESPRGPGKRSHPTKWRSRGKES